MYKASGNLFLGHGTATWEGSQSAASVADDDQLEMFILELGLTQSEGAKMPGVTQPSVSDLELNNVTVFSTHTGVEMFDRFDMPVMVTTMKRRRSA